jgi:hypothetical protein
MNEAPTNASAVHHESRSDALSQSFLPGYLLRNIVELHGTQDPLPADGTVLHFSRARQASHDVSAVVEGCFGRLVPADPAHALCLLCVPPVRHALAEFLIILPATDICVAGCCFDKGAGSVALVVDPVAIVCVSVLEGVESMAVALAKTEGTRVGSAGVVH